MAESSRVSLRYKKQSDFLTTAIGQFVELPFSEESFSLTKTKERKQRILSTREYAGVNTLTFMTEGGFVHPLVVDSYDEIFEGVLMSAGWTDITGGSGGAKITAGLSGSNLEITFNNEASPGDGGTIVFGSAITIDILKDQFIFVANAADSANNGSFIVKDVSGNTITVNSPLADAIYEDTTEISGDRLRNDSIQSHYTFERANLDIDKYFAYVGETVNTLEVAFESETEVMLTFDFMGRNELPADDSISSPLPAALADSPDFICGDNIDGIFIDYEALTSCKVQSLSFTISNQTEARKAVAVSGPCAMRIKPIDTTGSITLFFTDLVDYDKFTNDTEFQLAISTSDSLGNTYAFTLAKTEFSTGLTNAASAEDEVPEEHEFMVSTDGVFSVQICRNVL